jgi:hypothetical protein
VNPVELFLAGIAPEHAPALVAGLLAAGWLGTAARWRPRSLVDRWAGVLLGVSAAVHLALPLGGPGHHGPLVTAGFVASGGCYAVLAGRALRGRRWRLPAGLLVLATLVGYLVVVVAGDGADQVGIATALAELVVLGLAVVPTAPTLAVPPAQPPRRFARFAGSAATVTATFLVGAVVWAASFAAHDVEQAAADPATGDHAHQHEHTGRAQAGMIMRSLGTAHHATEAQRTAAAELAAGTTAATARYAELDAALAAGYRMTLQDSGTDVHLEHGAYKKDGATLDPARPEMLVYAIDGGRATLLGVVYVMDTAGVPGPQPGGPITRWHAHNVCATALPPGIGVVSALGGCPPFSVAVTTPEMMHVWVVDNPGGPFADGLDEAWVREYHARAGRPFTAPR